MSAGKVRDGATLELYRLAVPAAKRSTQRCSAVPALQNYVFLVSESERLACAEWIATKGRQTSLQLPDLCMYWTAK